MLSCFSEKQFMMPVLITNNVVNEFEHYHWKHSMAYLEIIMGSRFVLRGLRGVQDL